MIYHTLTSALVGFSLFLSCVENIYLTKKIKSDFGKNKSQIWLVIQCAILMLLAWAAFDSANAFVWLGLLLCQWACVALLGLPFMGGADQMSMLSTSVLFAAYAFDEKILGYLGAHVFLSYFVAGVARAFNRQAWNGVYLRQFLSSGNYRVPEIVLKKIINQSGVAAFLSSAVLLFELSFLFVIFVPNQMFILFMGLAVLFHLGNYYLFGLNRFFWAWVAAYPACVYLRTIYQIPS